MAGGLDSAVGSAQSGGTPHTAAAASDLGIRQHASIPTPDGRTHDALPLPSPLPPLSLPSPSPPPLLSPARSSPLLPAPPLPRSRPPLPSTYSSPPLFLSSSPPLPSPPLLSSPPPLPLPPPLLLFLFPLPLPASEASPIFRFSSSSWVAGGRRIPRGVGKGVGAPSPSGYRPLENGPGRLRGVAPGGLISA